MVFINKGIEPRSLTHYRLSTQNANYDGMATDIKNDIRANMLQEQGRICAYCMGRITEDSITIEHYIPQSVDSSLDLDYRNMIGVCQGILLGQKICGNHRGKEALKVNPLFEPTIDTIQYSRDGGIMSSDVDIDRDLKITLNLNAELLKANRKQALVALDKELKKKKALGPWKDIAERYIQKFSKAGEKREYYGILLYFLHKRIR